MPIYRLEKGVTLVGMLELFIIMAFGVALATFVITRLNSGLSRAERKRLSS
ncbi:hypothetical protein GCM10008179_29410 [Hansschlegelia plantiphila]|uniref:Uncharacterized protein n=1 Tax=Hansschlegelia plantiphila TaxID=374655 RepID=A0A9W6J3W6_9HYPH|nr:hypothetical protein GCM10008179_29410 [Hansschlegelia plantiphila]